MGIKEVLFEITIPMVVFGLFVAIVGFSSTHISRWLIGKHKNDKHKQ